MKLLELSQSDVIASNLLDSFLIVFCYMHKFTCGHPDCYLKNKKQQNQRYYRQFFKETYQQFNSNMPKRNQNVIFVVNQLYYHGIKKNPQSIKIRLRYAFFLLDNMHNKQQAINEFNQVIQVGPNLSQEFVVFRYKRIIEDALSKQDLAGGGFGTGNASLDMVTEISFQSQMNKFQNMIERVALLQMDFWSQLQEDNPDLSRLNDIGSKINHQIAAVEEQWLRMQKFPSNLPKAMRLYGKYLTEVLQDAEQGEDILDKARRLQNQNNKATQHKLIILMVSSDEISGESYATTMITTASDKFAQITNLNMAACNLFGYSKNELLNRKVNMLMSNLYSSIHDQYIERVLNTEDHKSLNSERFVYIKQKSNYIVVAKASFKILQSFDEVIKVNLQLVGQFRLIKSFRPSCCLIVDKEFLIDSVSSGCIPLLNLDMKSVFHRKISLNEFLPQIQENLQVYLSTQGGIVEYNNSTRPDMTLPEDLQQLQCKVAPIISGQGDHAGYVIRLERIQEEIQPPIPHQVDTKLAGSFQFKLYPGKGMTVQGEYTNDHTGLSQLHDSSVVWDHEQSSMASQQYNERTHQLAGIGGQPPISSDRQHLQQFNQGVIYQQPHSDRHSHQQHSQPQEQQQPVIKLNYGLHIRTVRLWDGKLLDIEDFKENMDSDEDYYEESVFKRNIDDNKEGEGQTNEHIIFRSSKALKKAVTTEVVPTPISILKIQSYILIIGLIIISFVHYFYSTQAFTSMYDSIELSAAQNSKSAELQLILTAVQNLLMTNMNILNFETENSKAQYIQTQLNLLDENTRNVKSIQNQYTNYNIKIDELDKKLFLSDKFITQTLEDLRSQERIKMYESPTSFRDNSLEEATKQVNKYGIIKLFAIDYCKSDINIKLRNQSDYNGQQ